MVKKLTKHGNSLALIIDRPILDLIGADASTEFDVVTDGGALILSPRRDKLREAQFRKAVEKVALRYSKTFEELSK